MKTGVLLVNLGTPDSYRKRDVYRYLTEFLTDERVIDTPWLQRQLLVRGLIIPARFRQSAQSYRRIWTEEGSPLKVYGYRLKELLQKELGNEFFVELAMRYQNPSIPLALQSLYRQGIKHLIVVPLFPQYASATTGSVHQKIMETMQKERSFPKMTFIDHFADHPGYIQALCAKASSFDLSSYDHILLSFHGLPKRQLRKTCRTGHCLSHEDCCQTWNARNHLCYSAQSHATAQALSLALRLPKERYTVCFQSRLGRDPWLQPYASQVIQDLARRGAKRLLAFCPSFVCDCLETIHEFSVEYQHEFRQAGGEQLDLVPGLNDSPEWVKALSQIVLKA